MLYGIFTVDYHENHDPKDGKFASGNGLTDKTGVKKREKAIRSLRKRIEAHREKIAYPEKSFQDWNSFTEERKTDEIDHWKNEIRAFEKEIRKYEYEISEFRERKNDP
jgi:chromosome segregation ATPase